MAAPATLTSSAAVSATSTMTKDLAPGAKALSTATPLSASFPSELRSPMLHSPRFGQQAYIKQENGALKTPITPPSAYIDFLKQFSPSMQSPLCTSASTHFSFSKPSPLGTNFGARTPSSATFARPLSATYSRPLSASMVRPPLSSNPSTNSSTSNASAATCASATSAASNIAGCSTPITDSATTPTYHRRNSSTTTDTTTRRSTTTTTTTESTTTSVTSEPTSSTPTSAPPAPLASAAAPTNANSSKPLARPHSSAQTYPYPSQMPARSSTSSSGALRPTLRIPQSPMFTPALMMSPGSAASSSMASTSTPQSMVMSSPVDWESHGSERKKGTVHVRQVVTRTITYCRTPVTPLEPAPRGKRRKVLHEAEGAGTPEPEGERAAEAAPALSQ